MVARPDCWRRDRRRADRARGGRSGVEPPERAAEPEERSKATCSIRRCGEAERAIGEGERDARVVERRGGGRHSAGRLAQAGNAPGGGGPCGTAARGHDYRIVLIAGALWVGSTRLIDNVTCQKLTMKLRAILKSKIHRAVVTGADIDYVGSVGVDQDLLERTDIIPGERVAIWNINNGIRIDTYAISLPRGSGQIVINGAAARHFHPGDKVIIVAFCLTDEKGRALF